LNLKEISPSRIATGLVALAGLLTSIAPLVAELQTDDIAGMVGGLLAVVLVVRKWLDGRSKWEVAVAQNASTPSIVPDKTKK